MGFMRVRHKCIDIDECKEFPGLCEGKLHCTNTIGTYTCGCRHGYETIKTSDWDLMMTIPDCKDIDECSNQDICPFNSDCQNTAGNYTCECNTGFEGYLCEDIDECNQVSSCHANSSCSNSYGNFTCSCNSGFRGDGKTCQEGECDDRSCPSGKQCVSPTTNDCECKPGFSLIEGENFCQDVDECLNQGACPDSTGCLNTEGVFNYPNLVHPHQQNIRFFKKIPLNFRRLYVCTRDPCACYHSASRLHLYAFTISPQINVVGGILSLLELVKLSLHIYLFLKKDWICVSRSRLAPSSSGNPWVYQTLLTRLLRLPAQSARTASF